MRKTNPISAIWPRSRAGTPNPFDHRSGQALRRGESCKTNPISPRRRWRTGKLCKTKPNLEGLGYVGKDGGRVGRGSPASGTCKTNPIGWAGGPGLRIDDCGLRIRGRRPGAINVGRRASASRSHGPNVQNEPNLARAPGSGRWQPGPRSPGGERLCKTNPISAGVSRWKCQVFSEEAALWLQTANGTLQTGRAVGCASTGIFRSARVWRSQARDFSIIGPVRTSHSMDNLRSGPGKEPPKLARDRESDAFFLALRNGARYHHGGG
jgi:hypothetical protein